MLLHKLATDVLSHLQFSWSDGSNHDDECKEKSILQCEIKTWAKAKFISRYPLRKSHDHIFVLQKSMLMLKTRKLMLLLVDGQSVGEEHEFRKSPTAQYIMPVTTRRRNCSCFELLWGACHANTDLTTIQRRRSRKHTSTRVISTTQINTTNSLQTAVTKWRAGLSQPRFYTARRKRRLLLAEQAVCYGHGFCAFLAGFNLLFLNKYFAGNTTIYC